MADLKTDPAILTALLNSVSRPLSSSEQEQQRLSFVMASLSESNDLTREQVQEVIRHRDVGAPAR